jgi:hypothetical protein
MKDGIRVFTGDGGAIKPNDLDNQPSELGHCSSARCLMVSPINQFEPSLFIGRTYL